MKIFNIFESSLKYVNDIFQKLATILASTLIGLMTLVILYMVYFRYILNDTPYWSEEVARCMMLWMTFIVLPVSYRLGSNVALEIILGKLKGKLLIFLEIFIHLLILTFIINFFYLSLNFVKSGMMARAYSFDLQIGYIYLVLPISFTFMFLVSIELILTKFKKLFN
jgi:TRAP-type transport system small permease protein